MRLPAFRCLVLSLILSLVAVAADAATPEQEIDHLLDFIAGSTCIFIRNDVEYRGPEAVAHIKDKYDYYRDKIKTAEDFIDLAATRSTLSGRPYFVRCDPAPVQPARDWLLGELTVFRKQQP